MLLITSNVPNLHDHEKCKIDENLWYLLILRYEWAFFLNFWVKIFILEEIKKTFNPSFKNLERFFEDRGGVKRNKLGESRGREIAARRRDRKMWQLIIFTNSKKSSSHFFVFLDPPPQKKTFFRFLKTYISTTSGSNGVREIKKWPCRMSSPKNWPEGVRKEDKHW